MAIDHEFVINSHPNIYTGYSERKLKVYMSEPAAGINKDTGICLLIAGFGADSHSKVYRKMRGSFADKYNLVTIQCDYFGKEFMGDITQILFEPDKDSLSSVLSEDHLCSVFENNIFHKERLFALSSKYDITFQYHETLDENLDNFNDMGLMQSLDNLTALLYVVEWIKNNHRVFNAKKIIAYGHSHGAYLSYLCNAFSPQLFSLVIDNSAWLVPNYLTTTRILITNVNRFAFHSVISYLASKMPYDYNMLCLPMLYKTFRNQCRIVSFQGSSDNLVLPRQKRSFCSMIENCTYVEIGEKQVDGHMFRSTEHGLDADFLELFDFIMNNHDFGIGEIVNLSSVEINTQQKCYEVTFGDNGPLLAIKKENESLQL